MNSNDIETYVKQIEATGLKQHDIIDNADNVHHFVIQIEYDVTAPLPKAFEACYDDGCNSVMMFYLEDCSNAEADEIVDWLKNNSNWSTKTF